jgi:hypothetical protein
MIPEEPAAGGEDVAEVVFRAPGSGKRLSRRFVKSTSVKTLYDYVRTLDPSEDLGFDDASSKFELF